MPNSKMSCSLAMSGKLCGVPTELCGCSDSNGFDVSAGIKVNKKTLGDLMSILGAVCRDATAPYINMLNDFEVEAKFSHSPNGTAILIESDTVHFWGCDTKQGKMVAFSISLREMTEGNDSSLAEIIKNVTKYFGFMDFKFLYRSNDLTSAKKYERYPFLPRVPYNIDGNIIFNASFQFDDIAESSFSRVMRELFGIAGMDLFLVASNNKVECDLVIPDVNNSLLQCKNIIIRAAFGGTEGVAFEMSGIIALQCFSAMQFAVDCTFSMTSVSISASSVPAACYQIPMTPITICNSGLEIGFDEKGLNFAAMTQLNIRNLMWYGALRISYQGQSASLDMLSAAMSSVSVSELVENLIGISGDKVSAFDVIAIKPFELNSQTESIDFANMTDDEIIAAINNSLTGMNREFLLDKEITSITRLPANGACDVLNTNTMFHYWITKDGRLSFPPQAYFSSSNIRIGKYNFEKGIFFSGNIQLFGYGIRVMFSVVSGEGLLGFAQLKPIVTRFMKITGSVTSKEAKNIVLGNASDSTLSLLATDYYSEDVIADPVVLYVNICRNAGNFYIDGHFELCDIFSFDALMYYMNKRVFLSVETSYFNLVRASVYFDVAYKDLSTAGFAFGVSLDCSGLHDKLGNLTRSIERAVESYDSKIRDAQSKIRSAKIKVEQLQAEINKYNREIQRCKDRINRTSRWKRWLVAISEGSKIGAYEIAILSIKGLMEAALLALDIANKALDLGNKLGTGVLNAIDGVIKGVLNAFYINKAVLNVLVNGNTQLVSTEIQVTVLGKEFYVNENINLEKLAKAPVELLEDCIMKNIKSFLDNLPNGHSIEMEVPEKKEYPCMEIPESPIETMELASYGAKRINNYKNFFIELQKTYIDEMKDIDPDFENLDTEFKEVGALIAYSIDASTQNMCVDGMDYFMEELKRLNDEGSVSEEDATDIRSFITEYTDIIRPTTSGMSELANRIRESVCDIDTEAKRKYLHRARQEDAATTGVDLMESRNYDRLFNEVEALTEKYFPRGSGKGFFNYTDEVKFYEMLNEARSEAGCAVVSTDADEESSQLYNRDIFMKGIASVDYRSRF